MLAIKRLKFTSGLYALLSVSVLIDNFGNSFACLNGKEKDWNCVCCNWNWNCSPVQPSSCGSAGKLLLMRKLLNVSGIGVRKTYFCNYFLGNFF